MIFIAIIVSSASIADDIQTQTYTEDWYDAKRDRIVPVRIFLPPKQTGNTAKSEPGHPVVLLSHGLGGSRDGFGYLGEHWSKSGYVVIVMQHPGSDRSIFSNRKSGEKPQEIMQRAASTDNATDRYEDVQFVLDQLKERNQAASPEERLTGRLDLNRIGIGGHSFGSQTALAVIGRFPYKADPRIKAAIAMSPNQTKAGNQKRIHASIKTPTLHLTGTKDGSPLDRAFNPEDRRIPYNHMTAADRYLVVFKDGNHMLFSGHARPFGLTQFEKKYQPLIVEITQKFLDAYLRDDADAMQWLQKRNADKNDLQSLIRGNGTAEFELKQ